MRDHRAAMDARARPHVEHVVGLSDGLLVMLHHDHGVARVAQVLERRKQPVVVALVQPDGRLVEHVEHTGEPRADLGGQPDALRLAARQRARGPRKRQVFQPDIVEEPEPFPDLLEDRARDLLPLGGQAVVDRARPGQRLADRHAHDLADVQVGDPHGQRLGPEAVAVADPAGAVVLVALELLADPVRLRLAVAALHIGDHALEGARHGVDPPALVVAEGDVLPARAVQEDLLDMRSGRSRQGSLASNS